MSLKDRIKAVNEKYEADYQKALELGLSNGALAIIDATRRGYTVTDEGLVTYGAKPSRGLVQRRNRPNLYYVFALFNLKSKRVEPVYVHALAAYQKFGFQSLQRGVCVRHLNGDCRDNRPLNLALGTVHENTLDRMALGIPGGRPPTGPMITISDLEAMRRLRREGVPWIQIRDQFPGYRCRSDRYLVDAVSDYSIALNLDREAFLLARASGASMRELSRLTGRTLRVIQYALAIHGDPLLEAHKASLEATNSP